MKQLEFHTSADTPYNPEILCNPETGDLQISGESYMENAFKFYEPVMEWIRTYMSSGKGKISLSIKLIYLNTSTSRCIVEMLELLKTYRDSGGEVVVNWYYEPDDANMKEEIEDIQMESGVQIHILEM